MTKKIIAANWKMNPATLAEGQEILERADEYLASLEDKKDFTLLFCPPFVFLEEISKHLDMSRLSAHASLGAQDISTDDSGAFTGEVSGPMLKKLGVKYVIIGHSERRWKMDEPDEVVNQKLKAALRNELTPIVCIGERVRDGSFKSFLKDQVSKTFAGLGQEELKKCIVAYEPVWAISSNPGATADSPEESIKAIKAIWGGINELGGGETWIPTLYGGSVNSHNIADFISRAEIDGVLIGSASVNKDEFVKILSVVQELI